MRFTDAQLKAILHAGIEAEAGGMEEWEDDLAKALPKALDKLRREYWRRQDLRPSNQEVTNGKA